LAGGYGTSVAIVLQAPQLLGQLLIAELQVLDHSGELPDLRLKAIDAQQQIIARALLDPLASGGRLVVAAEQAVEEARLVCALAKTGGCAGQNGGRDRKRPERAKMQAVHECRWG
jgi:hypothetical protein